MKNKINILIVEDEPLIADDIAFIVEDTGHQVIGKAIDVEEAIALLNRTKPDLVLLDISLDNDDEDGIDLAHTINEQYQIPFIFITSYSDKLTLNRVKRTNPCGFIVKPFKPADIQSIISLSIYKNKKLPSAKKEDSFFIKKGYDLLKIKFKDILYVKAEDNFTDIILDNKKILASLNLKTITEKLPKEQFIRIHRSYVININKIDRISDRYVFIDTHKIPLGRTYSKVLREYINTLY